MAQGSSIEWTDSTWNPVTGCTKVSAGCKHCYAERMARRLQAMGVPQYADGFRLTLHPEVIELPLRWKRPRTIFVNSMSDLFHKDVPLDFIQRVFAVMERCPQHTFQILTKRPEIAAAQAPHLPWPDHVWLGTSIEDQAAAYERIPHLSRCPAAVRFLSIEPLLGPVDLTGFLLAASPGNIGGVIVGGESGPGARPMNPDWVRSIRDQCRIAGVPFFFKQWGGVNKKRAGRILDGRTWDELPELTAAGRPYEKAHTFRA